MNSPFLLRADQTEVVTDGPTSLISLLVDSDCTGGTLTANRVMLCKNSPGAPPHCHYRAHESLLVLDGTLDVLAGKEILTLQKNDFIVIPPRKPHAFAPPAGLEADVLMLFTPGLARFEFYRLLEKVYKGEADPKELPANSDRYDNHYLESPIWRERFDV